MRATSFVAGFVFLASLGCDPGPEPGTMRLQTREGVSPAFHIAQLYRSMEGPSAAAPFALSTGPRQLVWIVGFSAEIVGEDGEPIPEFQHFMGLASLDFDPATHLKLFGIDREVRSQRLVGASQGVSQLRFPVGYGIPVLSDEPFSVHTMVLNHDRADVDLKVRQRIRVQYIPDEDAAETYKPLFPTLAPVLALVSGPDGHHGVEQPDARQAAAECAPGQPAPNALQPMAAIPDGFGRVFTRHWVLPPGREERRTRVTDWLNLPFDTTIHTLTAELHPFSVSLALRDLNTGDALYTERPEAAAEGIGVAAVRGFSERNGIPVFRDHEYEVVSVYDNSSGADQDALATLHLYYYDEEMDARLEGMRAALRGSGG